MKPSVRTELTVLKADDPKDRVIGWKVHETVGVGVVNPRGLGQDGSQTVIPWTETPAAGLSISARWRPEGLLDIRWLHRPAGQAQSSNGILMTFDGLEWTERGAPGPLRPSEVPVRLARSALFRGFGDGWELRPELRRAEQDPLWAAFVLRAEDAFRIASVMLT